MPWSAYVPAGTVTRVSLPTARPPGRGRSRPDTIERPDGVATEPILVGPDDVEIEIRGAGNATRRSTTS
jgi:hypothetical protein